MIQFLKLVMDALLDIFALDFIPGISIYTILFYDLLLVCFFTVFAHRR